MLKRFKFELLLLLLSAVAATASASCLVTEEASGQEKECKFPFTYKGVKVDFT